MRPPSEAPLSFLKTRDRWKTLSARGRAPVASAEACIFSRVSASILSQPFPLRALVACGVVVGLTTPAFGQRSGLTERDSALVGRILLAEDRRDSASAAFGEGARHADLRIRQLAWRASARVRDPRFAARDSLPPPAAPPAYDDAAWRLRFRALAGKRGDCAALRAALTDSVWAVRLRAADVAEPECARDTALVRALRNWASAPPPNGARRRGEASWHPAAHAVLALARIAPDSARVLLRTLATSAIPWLRAYAARAAGTLADTALLRRLAADANDNVKEQAIDALSKVAGHKVDDAFLLALTARGYQTVRAGARALAGSPRRNDVLVAVLAAARRLRGDSSETSRDARLAVLERVAELAGPTQAAEVAALASDFDCIVAQSAAAIAARVGTATAARCTPMTTRLPPDAVRLALGTGARLRVILADSSGGGAFTVRLRGDVAPIMAARILSLARAGYYDGLAWQRVEPDFVIQGGSPGANEYVGHPRFIRDELGTVPHMRGTVGMSTRGHDTGDAQWFVNLRDNLRLNRDYTVFGEVVDGLDVVDGVLEGDVIARIEVLP